MYGYIRPLKGELKVSDYELFKQSYCGLCHALGQTYRLAGRFIVNYDFLFLAMLLSKQDSIAFCKTACPAKLSAKVKCVAPQQDMLRAANESIILAYWKVKDGIADSSFCKGLKYRMALPALLPAYKKAEKQEPDFAAQTDRLLSELKSLEISACTSLDMTADKFADILKSAAASESNEKRRRALESLLYHIGRIVYILDAVDDLGEDIEDKNYNPLIYRFDVKCPELTAEQKQSIRETLIQSQREASAAFELLERNIFYNILSNIIFLGIPRMIESVLNGDRQKKERRLIHYERSI